MTQKEAYCKLDDMYRCNGAYFSDETKQAIRTAMAALIDIQEYQKIGTIEECRAYRETIENVFGLH